MTRHAGFLEAPLATVSDRVANDHLSSGPQLASSEWPPALLLDEVWLRSRRLLVQELEAGQLWPERGPYRAFMAEQWNLGNRLVREVLQPVLGADDSAYLKSEVLFGPSNRRFRTRLPFVLSFGRELGTGCCRLLGLRPDQETQVADLCALFNLGISVFDLVHDTAPEDAGLAATFDQSVLTRLGGSAEACANLNDVAASLEATEHRLLLKLIAGFFLRLHQLTATAAADETPQRDTLDDLLLAAYQAEMGSIGVTEESAPALAALARAKSTLPFAIIARIALLTAAEARPEQARALTTLMHEIGMAVWLTDDLVDLVRDAQAGSLNALLVQACSEGGCPSPVTADERTLLRLLSPGLIENAARAVREHLDAARDGLRRGGFAPEAAAPVWAVVQAYTRNWIE